MSTNVGSNPRFCRLLQWCFGLLLFNQHRTALLSFLAQQYRSRRFLAPVLSFHSIIGTVILYQFLLGHTVKVMGHLKVRGGHVFLLSQSEWRTCGSCQKVRGDCIWFWFFYAAIAINMVNLERKRKGSHLVMVLP